MDLPPPFDEANAWFENNYLDRIDREYASMSYSDPYMLAYDQLLTYCFGMFPMYRNSFFMRGVYHLPKELTDQAPRCMPERDSLEFIAVYDRAAEVVMFVQVINEELEMASERPKPFDDLYQLADKQMRFMFEVMLPRTPLPLLWGLSFVNKSLRVYCGNKQTGEITPRAGQDVKKSHWSIDVSSPAGFREMKKIVKYVKDHHDRDAAERILEERIGKDAYVKLMELSSITPEK